MNISTILVVVPIERLDLALDSLAGLPGVEVHHRDVATGRVIVTLEAQTIHEEVAGLERIKAMPEVVLAEMVSHYFEDDPEVVAGSLPEAPRDAAAVPAFLEDSSLPTPTSGTDKE